MHNSYHLHISFRYDIERCITSLSAVGNNVETTYNPSSLTYDGSAVHMLDISGGGAVKNLASFTWGWIKINTQITFYSNIELKPGKKCITWTHLNLNINWTYAFFVCYIFMWMIMSSSIAGTLKIKKSVSTTGCMSSDLSSVFKYFM